MTSGGSHSLLPGARSVLALLLAVNLFSYIDRYVLAAVVQDGKQSFLNAKTSGSQREPHQFRPKLDSGAPAL